jgi:hypothetical protein
MLGGLLGAMLIGLSVLITREHVAARGGVAVPAQLAAGSFGTGWAYYATNIAVTLLLALAANTSFGGLPVLMSLLSADNRLPHLVACELNGRCSAMAWWLWPCSRVFC